MTDKGVTYLLLRYVNIEKERTGLESMNEWMNEYLYLLQRTEDYKHIMTE